MEDGPHVHQVFEDEVRKPGVRAAALCDSLARRWQGLDPDAMVAHLDAGRITEPDFLLLVGTRLYGQSISEYARNAGLKAEAAKKRRQRAEAAIRSHEKEMT